MNAIDYLRRANDAAKKARADGNTPFGAVLAGPEGTVLLEQGNEEKKRGDATAHAELLLASRASRSFSREYLRGCTLYTTCEPCPMCTGAVYWSNIGRIVYGISEERLLELTGSDEKNPTFRMGAERVIRAGQKAIALEGPVPELEPEITEVHRGFWNSRGEERE